MLVNSDQVLGRNDESMLTESPEYHQSNLFGSDLLLLLDPNDPLIQLASVIPW